MGNPNSPDFDLPERGKPADAEQKVVLTPQSDPSAFTTPQQSVGSISNGITQSLTSLNLDSENAMPERKEKEWTEEKAKEAYLAGLQLVIQALRKRPDNLLAKIQDVHSGKSPSIINAAYIDQYIHHYLSAFGTERAPFLHRRDLLKPRLSSSVVLASYAEMYAAGVEGGMIEACNYPLNNDAGEILETWVCTTLCTDKPVSDLWAGIFLAARFQPIGKAGDAQFEQNKTTAAVAGMRARLILDMLSDGKIEKILQNFTESHAGDFSAKELIELSEACDAVVPNSQPALSTEEMRDRLATYSMMYVMQLPSTVQFPEEKILTIIHEALQLQDASKKVLSASTGIDEKKEAWGPEAAKAAILKGLTETVIPALENVSDDCDMIIGGAKMGKAEVLMYAKECLGKMNIITDWEKDARGSGDVNVMLVTKTSYDEGITPITQPTVFYAQMEEGIKITSFSSNEPISDEWAAILTARSFAPYRNNADPVLRKMKDQIFDRSKVQKITVLAVIGRDMLLNECIKRCNGTQENALVLLAKGFPESGNLCIEEERILEDLLALDVCVAGSPDVKSEAEAFQRLFALYEFLLLAHSNPNNIAIHEKGFFQKLLIRLAKEFYKRKTRTPDVQEAWNAEKTKEAIGRGLPAVLAKIQHPEEGLRYVAYNRNILDGTQIRTVANQLSQVTLRTTKDLKAYLETSPTQMNAVVVEGEALKVVEKANSNYSRIVGEIRLGNDPNALHLTTVRGETPLSDEWAGILFACEFQPMYQDNNPAFASPRTPGTLELIRLNVLGSIAGTALQKELDAEKDNFIPVWEAAANQYTSAESPLTVEEQAALALVEKYDKYFLGSPAPKSEFEALERVRAIYEYCCMLALSMIATPKEEDTINKESRNLVFKKLAKEFYERKAAGLKKGNKEEERKEIPREELEKTYKSGLNKVIDALRRRPDTLSIVVKDNGAPVRDVEFNATYIDALLRDKLLPIASHAGKFLATDELQPGITLPVHTVSIIKTSKELEPQGLEEHEIVTVLKFSLQAEDDGSQDWVGTAVRGDTLITPTWAGILLASHFRTIKKAKDASNRNQAEENVIGFLALMGLTDGEISNVFNDFVTKYPQQISVEGLMEIAQACDALVSPKEPPLSLSERFERVKLYALTYRSFLDSDTQNTFTNELASQMALEAAKKMHRNAPQEAPKKTSGLFDLETLAGLSELMGVELE